jgi:hypothetical protein
VFYVLESPSPLAQAVVQLSHSVEGYRYAPHPVEALAELRKRGYVEDGTAFHAPRDGEATVHAFRNLADGSMFYTSRLSEGRQAGLEHAGRAFKAYRSCAPGRVPVWRYRQGSGRTRWVAGKRERHAVGAYYFDMWSPRAAHVVEATRRLYGRYPDWWGGVRDFYGDSAFDGGPVPRNTRGLGGFWEHLMPRIGYYDVRLPDVLAKHIEQAADAGLTYFSFYWYWDSSTRRPLLGEGIASFLAAPNRHRLRFSIALFAHPWDPRMHVSRAEAPLVTRAIVDLFQKPEYLRLPDGRPVLLIGDSRNIGDGSLSALHEFIARLKEAAALRIGKEPHVALSVDLAGAREVANADGIGCVATGIPASGPDTYLSMIRKTESVYRHARSMGRPFSACVTHMFDERPRQDLLPHLGRYLTGRTDEQFRRALLAARDTASEGRQPADRLITIYAWNEWHEGGILEPNVATGAGDLNIVTDVFGLPRLPSSCLDRNQCSGR